MINQAGAAAGAKQAGAETISNPLKDDDMEYNTQKISAPHKKGADICFLAVIAFPDQPLFCVICVTDRKSLPL